MRYIQLEIIGKNSKDNSSFRKLVKMTLNFKQCIIILIITITSCDKNEDDIVLTPKQEIIGYYSVTVTEQTAQSSQVGNTFELRAFQSYCSGFSDTNSFLNLRFGVGAGIHPFETCIPLDGYDITITGEMNMDMFGAPITGEGTFANGYFEFEGLIHRSVGDFTFALESSKKLGR